MLAGGAPVGARLGEVVAGRRLESVAVLALVTGAAAVDALWVGIESVGHTRVPTPRPVAVTARALAAVR